MNFLSMRTQQDDLQLLQVIDINMRSLKKQYSHFLGLPFIRHTQRTLLSNLQKDISSLFLQKYQKQRIVENRPNLAHISFCMLTLQGRKDEIKGEELMKSLKKQLQEALDYTVLSFSRLKYFSRYNHITKKKEVSVIYMDIDENDQFSKVISATDLLVRGLLNEGIIRQHELKRLRISYHEQEKMYKCDNYHLTLFRLKEIQDNEQFKALFSQICQLKYPLRFECDLIDISTRFSYEGSGFYRPLSRIVLESKQ